MRATPVDVLIPTCGRPAALAATLACLLGQTVRAQQVVVSDQTEIGDAATAPEVAAVIGVLRHTGCIVEVHKHLPRRGTAEHRQFLLDQARSPYCVFLDDDVLTEPDLLDLDAEI